MRMLQSPNGIIYLTGPTGSGKSTTLYMILEELAKRSVNISTIEDPVEKNVPKLNQMQVNNTAMETAVRNRTKPLFIAIAFSLFRCIFLFAACFAGVTGTADF